MFVYDALILKIGKFNLANVRASIQPTGVFDPVYAWHFLIDVDNRYFGAENSSLYRNRLNNKALKMKSENESDIQHCLLDISRLQ